MAGNGFLHRASHENFCQRNVLLLQEPVITIYGNSSDDALPSPHSCRFSQRFIHIISILLSSTGLNFTAQ